MTDHIGNDNQPARAYGDLREPDPHGQAALLLVESLIHALIGRSLLSVAEAVDVVETASEVKKVVAAEIGEARPTMEKSLALLGAIHASLSNDLPRG